MTTDLVRTSFINFLLLVLENYLRWDFDNQDDGSLVIYAKNRRPEFTTIIVVNYDGTFAALVRICVTNYQSDVEIAIRAFLKNTRPPAFPHEWVINADNQVTIVGKIPDHTLAIDTINALNVIVSQADVLIETVHGAHVAMVAVFNAKAEEIKARNK